MNNLIEVGTSTFDESDFILAVQDDLSCKDCRHCAVNKPVPNLAFGFYCNHKNNLQTNYFGIHPIQVGINFLCNKFEIFKDE